MELNTHNAEILLSAANNCLLYTSVPGLAGVYAASGLGSSGLTTGPIIGYHLAQLVQDKELTLDPVNYPIANYVKRVKSE